MRNLTIERGIVLSLLALALAFAALAPGLGQDIVANAATANLDEDKIYKGYTEKAKELQKKIHAELDKHPDWSGSLSWNATHATIEYLGPTDKDPNRMEGKEGFLAPATTINKWDSPKMIAGSTDTRAFKMENGFSSEASTSSTADFRQVLSAFNSNNKRWLQVGLVYDSQKLWATTSKWYVLYNVWSAEFASTSPLTTTRGLINSISGAPIELTIQANTATAGRYTLGGFDSMNLSGHSWSTTVSSDTGKYINLGQKVVSFPSEPFSFVTLFTGASVEEYSQVGTGKYNFGTNSYNLSFLKTSISPESYAVTGYHGAGGWGASVSVSNNPARVTYTYTG